MDRISRAMQPRAEMIARAHAAGVEAIVALAGALGLAESTLAELLAADGRFDEAAVLHDQLAVRDPDPSQDHALKALRLRARLN